METIFVMRNDDESTPACTRSVAPVLFHWHRSADHDWSCWRSPGELFTGVAPYNTMTYTDRWAVSVDFHSISCRRRHRRPDRSRALVNMERAARYSGRHRLNDTIEFPDLSSTGSASYISYTRRDRPTGHNVLSQMKWWHSSPAHSAWSESEWGCGNSSTSVFLRSCQLMRQCLCLPTSSGHPWLHCAPYKRDSPRLTSLWLVITAFEQRILYHEWILYQIESAVGELISWSSDNRMNVNTRKTKEMILGPLARNPPHQLNICNLNSRQRGTVLGARESQSGSHWNGTNTSRTSALSWTNGFTFLGSWSELECQLMTYFYKSVITPVAEYVCPAWHSSLTVEQSNRIESFQKRALKIIYNGFTSGDNAYAVNCIVAGLPQVHNLQIDVNSLLSVSLSRWRTLITVWTIYY